MNAYVNIAISAKHATQSFLSMFSQTSDISIFSRPECPAQRPRKAGLNNQEYVMLASGIRTMLLYHGVPVSDEDEVQSVP